MEEQPFEKYAGTIQASHLRSFIRTREDSESQSYKRKIQEWYLVRLPDPDTRNKFLICNTDHNLFWRATRLRHEHYPKSLSYYLAVEKKSNFDINDDEILAASPSAMQFSLGTKGNYGQYYIYSKISGLEGLLPNTAVVQAGWGENEPQLGDEFIIDAQNKVTREVFVFQNDPAEWLTGSTTCSVNGESSGAHEKTPGPQDPESCNDAK